VNRVSARFSRRLGRSGAGFWIANGVLAAAVAVIAYLALGSSTSSNTAATSS
jgi:hypothetical protein